MKLMKDKGMGYIEVSYQDDQVVKGKQFIKDKAGHFCVDNDDKIWFKKMHQLEEWTPEKENKIIADRIRRFYEAPTTRYVQ